MSKQKSIQLKAILLLLVFSINTVVGFACAMGFDGNLASSHHHAHPENHKKIQGHEEHAASHHEHPSDMPLPDQHVGNPAEGEHHNGHGEHDHAKSPTAEKGDNDCCNDEVLKIQSSEKWVNAAISSNVYTPVFVFIASVYFNISERSLDKEIILEFSPRFYYPPPSDTRIAFRRFQI